MDLHLPITTINGEPVMDLAFALPPLVRALSDRLEALQRGDPTGRIVLLPCVRRALLPIWLDLRQGDDTDPADLSAQEFLVVLVAAVGRLVDEVVAALEHNRSRLVA